MNGYVCENVSQDVTLFNTNTTMKDCASYLTFCWSEEWLNIHARPSNSNKWVEVVGAVMSVAGTVECDAVCWLCCSRFFKESQCLHFHGPIDCEEEGIVLLQMLGTVHLATQYHTPEDFNLQYHCCENLVIVSTVYVNDCHIIQWLSVTPVNWFFW